MANRKWESYFYPIEYEHLALLGCTLPPKSLGLPISQLIAVALRAETHVLGSELKTPSVLEGDSEAVCLHFSGADNCPNIVEADTALTKLRICDSMQTSEHTLAHDSCSADSEESLWSEVQKCQTELRSLTRDLATKRQTILRNLLSSQEFLLPVERMRQQMIENVYREEFVKKKLLACLREGVKRGPGSPDVCVVCFTDENLLECHKCQMKVHRHCYGQSFVAHIHPDWWQCDICISADAGEVRSLPRKAFVCLLCPVNHGAFKRVENSHQWVHVVCVMWLGLRVASVVSLQPLRMDTSNWQNNKSCSLCRISYGGYMQCVHCPLLFHPLCAFAQGLYVSCSPETVFSVYCSQHTPFGHRARVLSSLKSQVARDSASPDGSEDEEYVPTLRRERRCGYCSEIGHSQTKTVKAKQVIICPLRRKDERVT